MLALLMAGIERSGPTQHDIRGIFNGIVNSARIDNSANVSAFGATGNGFTDDTAAIQRAIDAQYQAGGGVVYFPSGVYVVSQTLVLKYRVSLAGLVPIPAFDAVEDATPPNGVFPTLFLQRSANCPVLKMDQVNGPTAITGQRWQRSVIENLHIFGNSTYQSAETAYGIDIEGVWGIDLRGVQVTKTKGHGIRVKSVNCLRIQNSNIFLTSGSHQNASCLYIDDLADSTIGPGNQLGGSPASVIYVTTGDSANPKSWLFGIHGNLAFNSLAGYGIELKDNPTSDRGINIQGNRFDQNYLGGIRVENTPGTLISGNVCVLNGLNNQQGQAGISLLTAPRTIVSSNVAAEYSGGVGENQDTGIEVGANSDYTAVVGNMTRPNDIAQITVSPTGNDNVRITANPGVADV